MIRCQRRGCKQEATAAAMWCMWAPGVPRREDNYLVSITLDVVCCDVHKAQLLVDMGDIAIRKAAAEKIAEGLAEEGQTGDPATLEIRLVPPALSSLDGKPTNYIDRRGGVRPN